MTEYAIGIDLGTTMSVVTLMKDKKLGVEVVVDAKGSPLTPSIVSFRPGGKILVGTATNA